MMQAMGLREVLLAGENLVVGLDDGTPIGFPLLYLVMV